MIPVNVSAPLDERSRKIIDDMALAMVGAEDIRRCLYLAYKLGTCDGAVEALNKLRVPA